MNEEQQIDTSVITPTIKSGGRLSVQDIMGMEAPFLKRKGDLSSQATEAKGEELQAKQAQEEQKAQGLYEAAQQSSQQQRQAQEQYKQQMEENKLPAFVPSKEDAGDLGLLFTLTNILGFAVGAKTNAQAALSAMNGMLEGHQKGREDLYKKEKDEFDKNFKVVLEKQKQLRQEMEDAVSLAATNKEEAQQKAMLAAAKSGSAIVVAQVKQGRLIDALKQTEDNQKLAEKAFEIVEKQREKDLEFSRQKELVQLRAQSKPTTAHSAINERFQNTVLRGAAEVERSLGLVEQIGVGTGRGSLGGVVGKGTMTSEVAGNLGRTLSSEEQMNYSTAMGNMALELAYVLNGGYKPNQSQVDEINAIYGVTPQDTLGTAAYKFSDVVAKLKVALEQAPDYTPQQKENKNQLLSKLDKYATPEEVYERQYGIAPRAQPEVRKESEHPEDVQKLLDKYKD